MSDNSDSDGDDMYGPALPPHLQKRSIDPEPVKKDSTTEPEQRLPSGISLAPSSALPSIGPTLPPGFKLPSTDDDQNNVTNDGSSSSSAGDDQCSDSDDDVIGPLPPDHPLALARADAFASASKPVGDDKPKKKLQREEWMLIPPSNKPVTELGLGPRKFLQRAPEKPVKDNGEPMDSDEELERETRAAMDQKLIDDYDKKMEAMIEKTGEKKRKSESLLEQHQRELKKKSKKEAVEDKKRKPFDRNTDLAVSGLSREDSKKYIEKTKELGGRFAKGRQKFL
ncbi:GPALPP motifs-containing protein 1 isoform X2 [Folsomia candida]|uniref:GPALPP motifs-containing protein 1 isoform X2 n=1 Tax=Folsomia candida TaxID=158441 RepID=UPI0016052049|nr:GPALPP motifs-containing protein 1 isoform X2 [Folsomia candida]